MKRKLTYFLMLIFMFFGMNTSVLAESEFVVTVDNSSFTVSDTEVTVGDTVTIQVAIESSTINPLRRAIVYFTKPVTKQTSESYYMEYNLSTGLYELSLAIDDTWQNGTYMIDHIYFADNSNVTSLYNSKNPNALWYGYNNEHNQDLSGCSFTVSGSTADSTFPVIDATSLTTDKRQVVIGDEVKYTIKISDDTSIKEASVWIENKEVDNWEYEKIDLKYNVSTDRYEGILNVDSDMEKGLWNISWISATDSNGNETTVYKSGGAWSSSKYSLYNYRYYPGAIVTTDSVKTNIQKATSGDTVNVSLQAMEHFGISRVLLFYKTEDGSEHALEAEFSSTDYTEKINGVTCSYNTYKASLSFNDYGYNGSWKLERIVVINSKNNTTTIYNSELSDKENSIDLSFGGFETYGLIDDTTAPKISKFTINKASAYYKESIVARVYVTDDKSGIQNVILNYTLPNGSTKDYSLKYDGTCYLYEFQFDTQDKVGEHTLNSITVLDKAGNTISVNENLNNMDFIFANYINIVSPAEYLETATSYNMKALLYPMGKVANVTWKSSNTNIASINATTGILTTKYSYGKVTITATANDGSGIYAKIDLVVSNSKLLVGQTVSLGNSNYIGYSEVSWEIEDESILQRTGSYGTIAINSKYKHSIGVSGAKVGQTTLKMLTLSGDVLSSSVVYVYDKVTNLSSDVKTIEMGKNDTVNVCANVTYYGNSKEKTTLYYVSDNEKVATVDPYGNVTAVGGGEANITVYSKYTDKTLTIPVTVWVYATDIIVDKTEVTLTGEKPTHQIEYNVEPSDATIKTVSFKSSNEKIVKVSNTGLITALRNGEVTITVKTNDSKQSKEIKVIVENFKIDINNLDIILKEQSYEYTGTSHTPKVEIKDDGYLLQEGKDYSVKYLNNVNIGEAKVELIGKGNYKGAVEKIFYINHREIGNIEIESGLDPIYSDEIELQIVAKYKGEVLEQGKDYTLNYKKQNLNVGEIYNLEIVGCGIYTGYKNVDYILKPLELKENMVEVSDIEKIVQDQSPNIEIKFQDKLLVKDQDYNVTISAVGHDAKVRISFIGNYTGSIIKDSYMLYDIAKFNRGWSWNSKYTSKEVKVHLTTIGNLIEGKDYVITYKDNINVGKATFVVTGINEYTGTYEGSFNIEKCKMSQIAYSYIENQAYTGSKIAPKLTLKNGDVTLVEGTDYTLTYTNNTKIGTAKVKVEGIGNYEGTKEISFKILKNIASAKVSGVKEKTYTGSKQTQSLTVKYGSTKLKNGKDYTISYSNNVNAGTAKITITGKGSYAGTKTVTFKIARRSISKLTYSKVSSYTYTGKAITPGVTVKYGKKVLVKDTDYTISYSKNVNSGTATITVTGKGNFAGTKKITFAIKDRSISSATIVGLKSKTYTGSKQYQSLTLTYNGITLKNGTDYTLSYKSNINAGTASVTITGKGNFNGSKTLKFKIWDRNINDLDVTASKSLIYTGNKREPSVTVKYGSKTLKKNTDYKVAYSNNVNVGTGKITVTGIGNYTGTKTLTFEITKRDIATVTIKGLEEKTYTGSKLTQSLKLTYAGNTLKNGTHYTLTYENNINAGTASVTITGIGNFYGEKTLTYKIARRSISNLIYNKVSNYTYTGKAITPGITVKYGKITLEKDTDYTVAYSNNIKAGTATITVTGKGNFAGTKKITFSINKRSISSATVEGLASKVYTGKKIYQSLTLTYNEMTLEKDTDYTLTYKNNTEIGIASVTITGKGNYNGSKTLTFKINPPAPKITSATTTNKNIKVVWGKVSSATGYELYMAKDDGAYEKLTTITKNSTVNYTVKSLADGEYSFKVRAYKTVGKTKYYSVYSEIIQNSILSKL